MAAARLFLFLARKISDDCLCMQWKCRRFFLFLIPFRRSLASQFKISALPVISYCRGRASPIHFCRRPEEPAMASKSKETKKKPIEQYEHKAKTRPNNPPVGLV